MQLITTALTVNRRDTRHTSWLRITEAMKTSEKVVLRSRGTRSFQDMKDQVDNAESKLTVVCQHKQYFI